ncbi:C2-domain-containing protein [Neoconidiobolus thromboides FSU 785]|nr:C2-domain-containing protein [Neoconidiobolus thromboides FSU 785]
MSGNLRVTVVEARGLANRDGLFGKNDAYTIIKVGGKKERTKTIANAGKNARWNETFNFQFSQNDEIHVDVWDYDRIKDDLIGSIKIPALGVMNLGYVENWYPISMGAKNSGEILLQLQFSR